MTTLLEPAFKTRLPEPARAPYPQQIILDWTDYCNAKCFFCYREKYEEQIGGKGGFIPFAKLKKLERALSQVKFFGISSGIGEPLLHPELEQILAWLYEINPAILIRTTTNGTALTASKAPWFAGHLDWLSVSLNASNGEAHMRDMFPHLAIRGIDAERRWQLHLRHLREFIAALPPEDRPRIRFQMVAHRHNVKDIPDFVRVVQSIGGSHAVITNIAVHSETVDWSLFWVKDLYNDAVEEACELGTRIGVRVDAARFHTSVKPVLDLDKDCHDPTDNAYISRASVAAPCCQWAEAGIPTEVYDSDEGFDRYWNHEILQRLRQKRNSQSCQVCGMSRVFDETSFHFSPKLKQDLIGSGRLGEINSKNDYPDATLVRACVENRLDLPSIRRTLLALGLPAELAEQIKTQGLAALPVLDQACWEAFKVADVPVRTGNVAFAGPFLGIGWGMPIHEPQNRVCARWIGGNQVASLFVRLQPGKDYELSFAIHHAHPSDLVSQLGADIDGRPLQSRLSPDSSGRTVFTIFVLRELTETHDGRLHIRIKWLGAEGKSSAGHVSLVSCDITESDATTWERERDLSGNDFLISEQDPVTAEKDRSRAPQRGDLSDPRLVELEKTLVQQDAMIRQQGLEARQLSQELHALYASRSWWLTTPLRKIKTWLRP